MFLFGTLFVDNFGNAYSKTEMHMHEAGNQSVQKRNTKPAN